MRDTGVDLNGPEHVSASELRRRQLSRSQQLHPTYYMYDTPQDGSTLCELCRLNDTHVMKRLFVGHDDNDPNHRHLLCAHDYEHLHNAGSCPMCRRPIPIWRRPKVVQIAANGTETVFRQGQNGGKRNHTHGRKRRHNRKRMTRHR